jgi:hypothetical protein
MADTISLQQVAQVDAPGTAQIKEIGLAILFTVSAVLLHFTSV